MTEEEERALVGKTALTMKLPIQLFFKEACEYAYERPVHYRYINKVYLDYLQNGTVHEWMLDFCLDVLSGRTLCAT